MNINIQYKNTNDMMQYYVLVLDPILKLQKKDRMVLGALLANYSLNKVLDLGKNSRKAMREYLKISEASFNNSISLFKRKDILIGEKLNSKLTINLPTDKQFNITFKFNEQSN